MIRQLRVHYLPSRNRGNHGLGQTCSANFQSIHQSLAVLNQQENLPLQQLTQSLLKGHKGWTQTATERDHKFKNTGDGLGGSSPLVTLWGTVHSFGMVQTTDFDILELKNNTYVHMSEISRRWSDQSQATLKYLCFCKINHTHPSYFKHLIVFLQEKFTFTFIKSNEIINYKATDYVIRSPRLYNI